MENFKVGDLVSWESQAAGHVRRKEGRVVAIVPRLTSPMDTEFGKVSRLFFQWGRAESPSHRTKFGGWPRDHESYLVEVRDGKTTKAKPKLYWPRASALKDANPVSTPDPPA